MKIKEVLEKSTDFLRNKKIDNPRFEAELLISTGLGIKRIDLYLKHEQPLLEDEIIRLRQLVQRRGQGEPVAYITGTKGFYGFEFIVTPDVLIPRPETETLIDYILEDPALDLVLNNKSQVKILDLGSGSGCLGLSLLKKIPNSILLAIDFSKAACEVTHQNAIALQLLDRCQILNANGSEPETWPKKFYEFIDSGLDLLVSNPPYIAEDDPEIQPEVLRFEPNTALFAKDEGLHFIKTWSEKFNRYLNSNSLCMMEIGYKQGPACKTFFESLNCFNQVDLLQDLSGRDRYIKGVRHG